MKKEYDNYVIRSINHDMYNRKVRKNTLSAPEEKRWYLIEIEGIPWDWISSNWKSMTVKCSFNKNMFIKV